MKVSQEKKKEIRKELIAAAVEIITEKGFKAATMREISAKAGYGSATIYNYFPTKEKILYAYFEDSHEQAALTLEQIPDLPEFTLKEKLQVQLESLLDVYLQDREFVMEAYKLIFDSPLRTFSEFVPIRDRFTAQVRLFIETAIENG
ncbi:MAG: TetR/AcrR family transcriptional regulator, partial [bacterium]|nr:TetR/AcrR family transcriptional regulator [bacterium]